MTCRRQSRWRGSRSPTIRCSTRTSATESGVGGATPRSGVAPPTPKVTPAAPSGEVGGERRARRGRQLEAHEVHGRRLVVVLALEVLVGDGAHVGKAFDADIHGILDAAQPRERVAPLVDVLVLDQ